MSDGGADSPRVSVVIASYRWPEALALSLASALAQTVEDLEVLVVEDGEDRASEAVVREARDPRARRLASLPNAGSQAGPNAHGWERARAPVVAYLGHDDLWHPEHLARLLTVLTPEVDLAHAVTLLLGEDDGGRLEVAGEAAWSPQRFVPPSSIVHWRTGARLGRWAAADTSGLPVDHAFLMACHAKGARVATSGAPTTFKFPAAWRIDSYRTRDVTPQARLIARLADDPDLGHDLLAAAHAAGSDGVLAAPPTAAPGVIADYNRRLKGLPARFAPRLLRWTPDATFQFPGWHPPEINAAGTFAWTGTRERAFVRLDAPDDQPLGVRVTVHHVVAPEQLEQLVVDLDGTEVAMTASPSDGHDTVLVGWLDRPAHTPTVEIGIRSPRLQPSAHLPGSVDTRRLGVAIAEIALLQRGTSASEHEA